MEEGERGGGGEEKGGQGEGEGEGVVMGTQVLKYAELFLGVKFTI